MEINSDGDEAERVKKIPAAEIVLVDQFLDRFVFVS